MNRKPLRFPGLLSLPCLVLAAKLSDPTLTAVRDWLAPLLLALSLVMALVLFRYCTRFRPLFVLAWLAAAGLAGQTLYASWSVRNAVLQAAQHNPARLAALGQHLIIGYDTPDDVRELARHGLIGGLFVTRRNIAGKTAAQLSEELAGLQAIRRNAGLPPLMITTDQEGGAVSRLSPIVPYQPPLSSLAGRPDAQRLAAKYGRMQAEHLVRLGINVNFSPVVDLKPHHPPSPLDWYTRIADRAIDSDPDTVSRIALAYSQALVEAGVTPTLKHFPGLGNVRDDTHLRSAHLSTPAEQLAARDWLPFRHVLERTPAMLMVGHATLDAIDPSRPASLSRPILNGLLRKQWQYDGILIGDDMTMAAVYDRGLCRASLEALEAGQDLLLVAYDWTKYYVVMDCLRRADAAGRLPDLSESRRRLQNPPWRRSVASPAESRT
ncbi:MAG: glycoside hydrolase family 3 N-terminal domain-containing protein [Deltaproteobacteria bacterium]|nr:glycoside hydrolase family 3 N-terminal domain-containing protein [Deltaproteobacteria bacterium]